MQQNIKFKIVLFVLLSVFTFTGAVFAADFNAFTGQINADDINLRVDATVGSTVICTLAKGKLVEIVSEVYDWYKIRLPKTAPSYIKKELVECIKNTPAKCSSAEVIGDKVNIRLGPSESSWILGKVDESTVVNIIQGEGNWYKIEPVHQSYGWINKKFINKKIVVFKQEEESASAVSVTGNQATALQPAVKDTGSQAADLKQAFRESGQLVVEGTVSPYGVVLWRKATHKLVTDNKEVYLLKGNRKGLDNLNYHKVKVTGKLISPENSKSAIIEVAIIEVLN